jgi:uncharacterized protein (DUF305 family)
MARLGASIGGRFSMLKLRPLIGVAAAAAFSLAMAVQVLGQAPDQHQHDQAPASAAPVPTAPPPTQGQMPMMHDQMPMQGGQMQPGRRGPQPGNRQAVAAYRAANAKMHRDMAIQYSGNPDRDFVAAMIPHHQGAIDMARVMLQYGSDPDLRRMAQDIIDAQEREIATMRAWLATHPQ